MTASSRHRYQERRKGRLRHLEGRPAHHHVCKQMVGGGPERGARVAVVQVFFRPCPLNPVKRLPIDDIDGMYQYADRLITTVQHYDAG